MDHNIIFFSVLSTRQLILPVWHKIKKKCRIFSTKMLFSSIKEHSFFLYIRRFGHLFILLCKYCFRTGSPYFCLSEKFKCYLNCSAFSMKCEILFWLILEHQRINLLEKFQKKKTKKNKVFQKFFEHCACWECIEKTFNLNKKHSYAKIMEEYNKQTIKIEKHIREESLTKLEKTDDEATRQKNGELEVLLDVKLLNLTTTEASLNQSFWLPSVVNNEHVSCFFSHVFVIQ